MDFSTTGHVPDRGPAVFAVTTATLVLATVFVAARMICRYFIVRNVTWDDKVIMLAWLIAFFLSFTIDYGVANGLGKHDADISKHDWPILRKCEYAFSILYNPALMATKSSILIFYLRLAKNTQVILRYASWATLVIVNIAGVVLTFMNIFQCQPIRAAWGSSFFEKTKCIPLLTEFICAAPVNILTDLAILALPIPVLTGMRLPSRQKTILVFTFTLGIFVTIVDVVRIYYLQQAIIAVPTGTSEDPNSRFGGQVNFAWNASLSLMWSAVEVNVGMTCACIPTLKPLMLKLLPAVLYDPGGTRTGLAASKRNISDSDSPRNNASLARPAPVAQPITADDDPNSDPNTAALDFLTTPGMTSAAASQSEPDIVVRSQTNQTMTTNGTHDNGVYFGFVNMSKPKSMLRANAKQSFKYCLIVSILFFLWGFSYGLLNSLNTVVGAVNHNSTAQELGLTSIYFGGGYFFGPLLVGEWILRRDEHNRSKRHRRDDSENVGGYKVTFIVGLCIYGIGTIIFWPSAVTNSYGGFMLSNFVVGFGLSVLEVGANSFLILCGPPKYGETRLLLAQSLQAVGSIVSNILAQRVIFVGLKSAANTNSRTLISVQWTYLAISLFCVGLALFFYYMPLPEVWDSELEEAAEKLPVDPKKKSIGGLQLRTVSLILAVLAQYIYIASQESNSIFFARLITSLAPGVNKQGIAQGSTDMEQPPGLILKTSDYALLAHGAFAVSRIFTAFLTWVSVNRPRMPQPRTILTVSIILCFIFSLLDVVLKPSNPNMITIPAILFFFAEGPVWPLIFAIGLRGQGRRTKRAAAFITMGGSGAAFFPFVMYGIMESGGSVQTSFIVIVALQVAGLLFPLFLDLSRDGHLLVDPCSKEREFLRNADDESPFTDIVARQERGEKSGSIEKAGHLLEKMSKGITSKLRKSSHTSSEANAEHSEGSTKGLPQS